MAAERRRTASISPYEGRYGFARAVRVDDRIIVAGTAPIWPDGSCDPDPAAQMRRCCEITATALEELGASTADVVRTRMFVIDGAIQDAVGTVHAEFFEPARPAATMVIVAGLLDPRWKIELESEAIVNG
jgi:enamine deaminase RidA (YjgF/YER057c/UK114 family)